MHSGIDMSPCADITLKRLGPNKLGVLQSAIMFGGADTGLRTSGEELGAVFKVDRHYLLFVEYGDPFEESLHISLLAEPWEILDWASFAFSGASGRLKILDSASAREIRFSFFAERRWTVEVYPRPRMSLALSLPPILRPLRLWRWFGVRVAQAEGSRR